MVLIDKRGLPVDDPWLYLQDSASVQEPRRTVLRLEQWIANFSYSNVLAAGVWIDADKEAAILAPVLEQLSLIVIDFPKTRDGRGFTLARMLRERYRFPGDLRAAGPLLPDQFGVLLQCGFTSLLAAPNVPLHRWKDAADALAKSQSAPRTFLDRLTRKTEA